MTRTDAGLATIALLFAAVPALATQAAPAGATSAAATTVAPPVLSTVPTTPAGMPSQPGSMSGLPLQVGDLPPGTVAVRVVRQPFTNVIGQAVELRIGAEGRPMRAETGSDGRAQFSGLSIGEHVIAVAVVDGERLTSQLFQLPAQGGVRVLLATGQGAVPPGAAPPATALAATAPSAAVAGPTAVVESGPSRTAIVLVSVFVVAGLGVWRSATRPRRAAARAPIPRLPRPDARHGQASILALPASPPPSRSSLLREKDRLFAELVQLELAREDGTPGPADAARREALLEELETVYAALGEPVEPV